MPIYEYQCPKCGIFETTQRITDAPLKKCPTCKSKVDRIISHTSFVLKGSGWYATDYGRSGKTKSDSDSTANGASDSTAAAPSSSTTNSDSSAKSGTDKSGTDKSNSDKSAPSKPAE